MKQIISKLITSGSITLATCLAIIPQVRGEVGVDWVEATSGAQWSGRHLPVSLVYSQRLWVMGGEEPGYKNDVWESTDGVNWSLCTSRAGWTVRIGQSAEVHAGKMWVIGGYDGDLKNDVWYSTDGTNWTMATSGAQWPPRYLHDSVTHDGKLWVLGGTNGSDSKNDVWYSTDGVNWTMATSGAQWSGRFDYAAAVHNGEMWVLGGMGPKYRYKNDVWHSTDGLNWIRATASASWPSRYRHTSVAYDGELWVMGGRRADTGPSLNDVWYSPDGIDWTVATLEAQWKARLGHSSVVYANQMWVLGGVAFDGTYENDVWYSGGPPSPTPITPTPSLTPAPTSTPTPSPTSTPSPTPSPSVTTTPSPTPSPTGTPTPSVTPTPTTTPTPAYCASPLNLADLEDLGLSTTRSTHPSGWRWEVTRAEAPDSSLFGSVYDNQDTFNDGNNYPSQPASIRLISQDEPVNVPEGDYLIINADGGQITYVYPPAVSGPVDVYYYIGRDGSTYNDRWLCDLAKAAPTPTLVPPPSITPSPSTTSTPTPTPTLPATATPTPSSTPTVTPSISPTPSPRPFVNWFLPAGGTRINGFDFDTYILIANPDPIQSALVEIRFVDENGPIPGAWEQHIVGPETRYSVKMNNFPECAGKAAVSTIVTSLNGDYIMCERAMYWSPEGVHWGGGHNTIGISEPGTDWFLAEGTTYPFDEYIHILNTDQTRWAPVTATFMDTDGNTWSAFSFIGPESNWTIPVEDVVGQVSGIATRVSSGNGIPLAVDRTMYWYKTGGSKWIDGHASRGVSAPADVWYLAEGTTHLFDEYILVINPSLTQEADVRITFMDSDGDISIHDHSVGIHSRYTVKVSNVVGTVAGISTKVESLNGVPVIAERAMYWPGGGPWIGGHNTIGTSRLSTAWNLPEGSTHLFDEYVLVNNPNPAEEAEVRFTLMDSTGGTTVYNHTIGPQTRYTLRINNIVPDKAGVATLVESTNGVPISAERAMYWDSGNINWVSGHCTIGIISDLAP